MLMNAMKSKQSHIHLMMLLMVILVASSFPVGAAITHAMPASALMFIRFLTAACLFLPFVLYKQGWRLPTLSQQSGYAVLSLPLVAFFWCMFESLRYTTAINTGTIYTLVPAITACYAFVINREETGKRKTLGLLLGMLGAIWIVSRGDLQSIYTTGFNKGDGLFLIGCLCMGFYNPMIKKLYKGEPMVVMTFWVIAWGSVWLLLLSLDSFADVVWENVEGFVYLGVLYLSIFTTLCSFFLLQLGTVALGPTRVAAYSYLTPLFVLLIGMGIDQNTFDWMLLPGIMMVALAMPLIQKSQLVRLENKI